MSKITGEIDYEELEARAARFRRIILDTAATWETQFDAGPGQVCSVSDAAQVLARHVVELEARDRRGDPAYDNELREAICAWVTANDLDPNRVPAWCRPVLDTTDPENITITVAYWRHNENGRQYSDPLTGGAATITRTVLLKERPPAPVLDWIAGVRPADDSVSTEFIGAAE